MNAVSHVKLPQPCEDEVGEGGQGPTFLPCATFWRTFTVQPNSAATWAAKMAGQELDPLFWWVPVDLVTGLSCLHVGTGFLSLSPPPHCAHPTCSTCHHALLLGPSVTALEKKNSNVGVIKANELLISTGEHN